MAVIAFVLFDLLALMFLLWCLVNFIRDGRRYKGVRVKVMRLDPMLFRRTANIFAMRQRTSSAQDRVPFTRRFASED